jgi:NADPH:quinone reductase-like Zn-dependent oxidoreductase
MYRAIVVTTQPQARADLVVDRADAPLGENEARIDVEYSSINFKDGLALPVCR